MILFVFLQPSPDVNINLSCMSQPTNYIYLELKYSEEYITFWSYSYNFLVNNPVFPENNMSICNNLFQTWIS